MFFLRIDMFNNISYFDVKQNTALLFKTHLSLGGSAEKHYYIIIYNYY